MSREKSSPSAQYRPILVSAFSPLFERGLPQGRVPCFVSACEAQIRFLPLWGFVSCRDGAHRSETTSLTVVHCMSGNAWWQRMVLLKTRGLWLYSIVRGGIGWQWRLACVKHGPNKPMDTSPRNRASREPDGPPLGMISPGGTESQPEALTLLVISNSWRRNVPPSSRRST
jgi:hypothetical protein